jgi:hypothetical protein
MYFIEQQIRNILLALQVEIPRTLAPRARGLSSEKLDKLRAMLQAAMGSS